jgi:hypothetical protein
MDFPFWGARNDHFRSWATIYFQSSASALRDAYISHRQTTAYHHESNGTVERLYRRHNMVRGSTLCAPRTLCTAEGRHWSLAEAVFGAPIMLLNEFLQNEGLSVDSVIKNFSKICMFLLLLCLCTILAPSCPVRCQLSCSSPPLIWVRRGSVIPPLQLPNDGPYAVLRRGPRSFTIQVGSRDEVIAVSHLKACTAADATPGSQHCHGRPPGLHPAGLAATKRVSFADPLVSSPSSPTPPQNGPGTVFLPSKEVFARPGPAAPSQPPQTRYPSHQRVSPKRLDL